MRYPIDLKKKAIGLRKRGFSLSEVSLRLKIAKSTASLWLSKVELNERAKGRLKKRAILGQYNTILVKRKKRKKLFDSLVVETMQELSKIPSSKELCRLLASMLFWCEGNKTTLTLVRFTNSEPNMIKCFLGLLRKGFNIDEKRLRALIHIHTYHDENRQIEFWSNITGIPRCQFHRSYRKPNTGKRVSENYQGCVAISYYDASVAKKLWAYYESLQKKF
ncbi:hypothetical protein COT03_01235 [Candidatus Shapirobacteria bacterium CG07_land_8_20_14_0_80_39_18]|uniref:Uncharacterized protein n=1 Tax=Candidatus Shapirobacteria bacterium CG07_land_8_20_14_0_80_39_18 TaxID=1974882 RepID=A0A2M6YRI3_9BACT|nr:MAG: hypothetical protein COT03_01235 [Candidatus Shapirobacteria bacterium CG07_land_8_20_14_0_80_39_18]